MSATSPDHPRSRDRDSDGDSDGENALPRAVGTWKRAYALVLFALAANVALLWLLGWAYR